ncbi:MAG: hypothetical protein PHN80_03455 [Hespellia sp.]|nr:hypothetical protein [Hespellia sp.]
MMMRNSIKQILRTPLRTVLFFLLIGGSTALLAVGINLWSVSVQGIEEFEKLFTTLGTVEQKPDSTEVVDMWDAGTQEYTYMRKNQYSQWMDESVLDFEGADYTVAPRKRPFFGAYMPDAVFGTEAEELDRLNQDWIMVVEVCPLETGPANPLEVEVVNKLNGMEDLVGRTILICDHHNPEPIVLQEGETYVLSLGTSMKVHSGTVCRGVSGREYDYEYYIGAGITSFQYLEDGTRLEDPDRNITYEAVTPDFYETKDGKAWMEVAREQEMLTNTVSVQPVDKTGVLTMFSKKEAYLDSGRDISAKEYQEGKDVCLISSKFAQLNDWKVGDSIELPLYFANYRNAPARNFMPDGSIGIGFSLINADKEFYQIFDRDSYEIVGIYNTKVQEQSEYGLAKNEIIIPYKSVTNSWAKNIVDNGPMLAATTSFEIPNGEIDSFMEAWEKQGIDGLEIKFYDGGYNELKEGIQNRQVMAYIFLVGGGVTTFLILLLFCHLFIAKQEKRTAIERSLGMRKGKCIVSMLSGLMLIVLIGVAAGGVSGYYLSKDIVINTRNVTYYDNTFSKGHQDEESTKDILKETLKKQADTEKGSAAAMGFVVAISCAISVIYTRKNLKKEPLYLLSGPEE